MKHTEQFKLAVVERYLASAEGYKTVARHYGIAFSQVKRWVAFYRGHGEEGLKALPRARYSTEFKLSVVQHMWDNNLSYAETSVHFNIRAQCCVGIWERSFSEGGKEAPIPTAQRTPTTMPDPHTNQTPSTETVPDDETRPREELLVELNYLRMENAYLKKLEALVQANQKAAAAGRAKRRK
jgi:transposase